MDLKNIRIKQIQETIHLLITDLGGYWDPLASFTRVAEELGELAQAVLQNDVAAIAFECADLWIITTCIANQYVANLEEEYATVLITEPISFLHLQCCTGELGRRLNHYEGLKVPKPTETIKSIQTIIGEFHHALFKFAEQKNIDLLTAVDHQLKLAAKRDKNRFEHHYDPASSKAFPLVIPFLNHTPLSKKLWCADLWNERYDLTQNIQQYFLTTFLRFNKIYRYEQLTALALVMPQYYGLNQDHLDETITTLLNLLPKENDMSLISFAPCLTHPYASPDNTILVFTPNTILGSTHVFN